MEEYYNLTYSFEEVFANLYPGEEEGLEITVAATFWYGRCFVLRIPDAWDAELTMTFNKKASLNIV